MEPFPACSVLWAAFERVDDKAAVVRLDGDDDWRGVACPPGVRNEDRSVIAKDDGHCADLVGLVRPEWGLGPGEALGWSVVVASAEAQGAGDTGWPVCAVSKMAGHSRCRQVPNANQYGCNHKELYRAPHSCELRR
jgi:hypothetical protein